MRALLYLLCGLAGGVAGGLVAGTFKKTPPVRAASAPASRAVDLEALNRIEALERRMDALAGRPEAAPRIAAGKPEEGRRAGIAPARPNAAKESSADAKAEISQAEIVRLARTTAMDPATANRLFGWLTLHTERIPDVLNALRAAIKEDPGNAELRVALATTLVAQLTNNTPPGPQQGLVWGQAVAAYDAAIKIDPAHWQARFGKAIGTTFLPRQFGQQPYAIKQFEELKQLQAGRAPRPEYAGTYYQLGLLYKDQGNVDKARQIWQEGLKLFPSNTLLKEQLEVTTQK